MCTFILAWRVFPGSPVVVAANRDEALDRPSLPPRVLGDSPRVIAPQDEDAGGTWIGYNERGVVVAVTNRWLDTELAGERSRGLLVRDALEHGSAAAARSFVEAAVADHEYAGFNLVIADADDAVLLEWDGALDSTPFDRGVHVVGNVGADDTFDVPDTHPGPGEEQAANVRRARVELRPAPEEELDAWLDRARGVLRDHDYGFCVHRDAFGTRSSSVIRIDADGDAAYWFADGPPCETPYGRVDVS